MRDYLPGWRIVTHHLRILHLSDLHERVALAGMDEERRATIRLGAARRARVLDTNFLEVLKNIRDSGPIDLICFTGDVADWGLAEEYAIAEQRIHKILAATQVAVERLFIVPGNHDVKRAEARQAWEKIRELATARPRDLSDWMGGRAAPNGAEPIWREEVLKRTATFWNWLGSTLGRTAILPKNNPHQYLGYRSTIPDFPFPVHVIGLDSAWLAGDNNDAKKLALTDGQINVLARDGTGRLLPGFRLALMHHSLPDLHDGSQCRRLLSETVDLLLYGHQHETAVETIETPDGGLQTIASGSLYEGDQGDRWVNGFNVIDADLDSSGRPLRYNVEFWGWSGQGHWHRNAAIYREAIDGRIVLWTPRGKSQQASDTSVTLVTSALSQQSLSSPTAALSHTSALSPRIPLPSSTVAGRVAVQAQPGDRSSPSGSAIDIAQLAVAKSLVDLGRSLDIPLATVLQITRPPLPPPLPCGYVPRPNILSDLRNWLNTYPVVAVIGYEECGKTAVVAEFSNGMVPCLWYSLPSEMGDRDSNVVGMLLAMQTFLKAQSIGLADLENAIRQFLDHSPLLVVIDNAHSLGAMDAIEFLLQAAAANNQLRVLLLGTDQPEFVSRTHESAIVTWRLPGMTSDQAVALLDGLGIDMIPVRAIATGLLRDYCDGHAGMLRLLANTVRLVSNEHDLADFISRLGAAISGNAAQFYAALVERFRQSLTEHELQLCRRLTIALHPFQERLARALWLDDGEPVDFPTTWNRCVASIFESHDKGRFSIPSLYQRGLMPYNSATDARRWHSIAASILSEPEQGVVDLFDICDSIWHYVLAESYDTAMRRACAILAIANHDGREDVVAYLLTRFDLVVRTCLDKASVTRRTRVLWYAMRTSFCHMVGQRKEAAQAAVALAALLKKPPHTGWTQDDLRALTVLLMYASRSGQTDIAVKAYRSLSPAAFADWGIEAKGVPVFLVLSAFIVANENPLPFVYELLCSPSRFAFPLTDLWSLPHDYELWRTIESAIYGAIDQKSHNKASVGKDMRSLLKCYQAAQRASLCEIAVMLGACLVRLRIDVERDYGAAVQLAKSVESISRKCHVRIRAHAKHILGDALRCQQRFDSAEAEYADALALWPDSDTSEKAQTALLLGIAAARGGNPSSGYKHAWDSSQAYARDAHLWQRQTRALLEGFTMAVRAGRYSQSLKCLIKAHSLLSRHRQCPEWVALAQCAMALVSPMGTFSVSDSVPMPGFTLGLPAVVPDADKMWPASPTAMLGRACGALGRPNRGIAYLESALSETTSAGVRNLTAFFCLELAISIQDIERATTCAIHASGMPQTSIPKGDESSFDEFLNDYVVARTISLAIDLSMNAANTEMLKAVIAKASALDNANTPASQLLLLCLAALRDTTETHDDTILDSAYATAIARGAFQVARNLAWWWCFRFHPGRPATIDKVTQWHWRLTWLTLKIGRTDAVFLRGFLSQEADIWGRLKGTESDPLVGDICNNLDSEKPDAFSAVTHMAGFLGSELAKVIGIKSLVLELNAAIRNMPNASSLSPAIQGAVVRMLDIVLMPGALTVSDELAQSIGSLADAIRNAESLDRDTQTAWASSVQRLYELFHAISSETPTREAFEALVSFADLRGALSPSSEANWYIGLRHLFGAARADRAVFTFITSTLRSPRVEQLLVHPKVPKYLRRRLAVCHAVAQGHHAIACLLSACMTRGIQSLGGIPYSRGALIQGRSEAKDAIEMAVAATSSLDEIERELRDEGCGHMDVWSCCHERGGLRKFIGAMLARHLNRPSEGNEWLTKSIEDFRLAIKAGSEDDEIRSVLNSAKEARSVAVFLQDTLAVAEFNALIEDACRQLAIDPLAEEGAEADDPLVVARDDARRDASWPTEETDIQEYADNILKATGLPEERRRSIEDDIRKQSQIERVQREFCRHLQPLQNLEHLNSPATAYLFTTKYTCSCQLLRHETRIENDDLDVVIDAMQRVYCNGCDRREPRA